ncbi:hypothetical protein BSKO_07993 [Bryopsis sp. KO-2023]|nr:hypothetical protein BSKO_07993 [Bryopsis sp. KO-2023]
MLVRSAANETTSPMDLPLSDGDTRVFIPAALVASVFIAGILCVLIALVVLGCAKKGCLRLRGKNFDIEKGVNTQSKADALHSRTVSLSEPMIAAVNCSHYSDWRAGVDEWFLKNEVAVVEISEEMDPIPACPSSICVTVDTDNRSIDIQSIDLFAMMMRDPLPLIQDFRPTMAQCTSSPQIVIGTQGPGEKLGAGGVGENGINRWVTRVLK